MDADVLLYEVMPKLKELSEAADKAQWTAYTEGGDDNWEAAEDTELKVRRFLSDPELFRRIKELKNTSNDLLVNRQLDMLHDDFLPNQIPDDLMQRMVAISNECEKVFNDYRGVVDGKQYSRNDVVEVLKDSDDSAFRQKVWESHKKAGPVVSSKVLELVQLRNQAAKGLGFSDYRALQLAGQQHDPKTLDILLKKLDEVTREPYRKLKEELDMKLKQRFGTEDLRPWHYADPFMQLAPQATDIDFDAYYEGKDVVEIARAFYRSFGMDPDTILSRSSLYPQEKKSEHAFAFFIDRDANDARILCNITPSDHWMDTTLHELGHALYDTGIDMKLPWMLRVPAHIFTTEGVALMFGSLTRNPNWLQQTLDLDDAETGRIAPDIAKQERLDRLFFSRWSLVMYEFEKGIYSDPSQDLNTLWWDLVERYQMVQRPDNRDEPDWATKDHIVSAPVYYHNYILGQFFYDQLLDRMAEEAGCAPSEITFYNRKDLGDLLKQKVFMPGASLHWEEFTKRATGKPLGVDAWAKRLE
jgi:peptidyl-dipeptidase A